MLTIEFKGLEIFSVRDWGPPWYAAVFPPDPGCPGEGPEIEVDTITDPLTGKAVSEVGLFSQDDYAEIDRLAMEALSRLD